MKKTGDMKEAGDLKKDRGYEKGRMHEKDKKNSRHQGTRVGSKEKSRRRKAPVLPENPLFLLEGAALIGVIAYLFYDSPVAAVVLLPLLYPYYRRRSGEKRRQEKKELSAQFREALAAIITALKAGYSAENAFVECLREMQFQFGEKAAITNEMKRIDLIVNRLRVDMVKRGEMMTVDDVTDILAVNLLGAVPDDEQIVISTNRGEPLVGTNCLAGKAYSNICHRIMGEEVPFLNLNEKQGVLEKLKDIFKKN